MFCKTIFDFNVSGMVGSTGGAFDQAMRHAESLAQQYGQALGVGHSGQGALDSVNATHDAFVDVARKFAAAGAFSESRFGMDPTDRAIEAVKLAMESPLAQHGQFLGRGRSGQGALDSFNATHDAFADVTRNCSAADALSESGFGMDATGRALEAAKLAIESPLAQHGQFLGRGHSGQGALDSFNATRDAFADLDRNFAAAGAFSESRFGMDVTVRALEAAKLAMESPLPRYGHLLGLGHLGQGALDSLNTSGDTFANAARNYAAAGAFSDSGFGMDATARALEAAQLAIESPAAQYGQLFGLSHTAQEELESFRASRDTFADIARNHPAAGAFSESRYSRGATNRSLEAALQAIEPQLANHDHLVLGSDYTSREFLDSFDLLRNRHPDLASVISSGRTFSEFHPGSISINSAFARTALEIESSPIKQRKSLEAKTFSVEIIQIAAPPLLGAIMPNLVTVWTGANFASRHSDNPDRARQVATSLREVMSHTLHRLSPDEEILKWISSPAQVWNDRPTRRTRFHFAIARNKYVLSNEEKKAAGHYIKHMEALHGITHQVDANNSDSAVRKLIEDTRDLISDLLRRTSANH